MYVKVTVEHYELGGFFCSRFRGARGEILGAFRTLIVKFDKTTVNGHVLYLLNVVLSKLQVLRWHVAATNQGLTVAGGDLTVPAA